MKRILPLFVLLVLLVLAFSQAEDFVGRLSVNPFAPDSLSNPYGAGSPFRFERPPMRLAPLEIRSAIALRPTPWPLRPQS